MSASETGADDGAGYRFGLACLLVATLFTSLAGLFVRLIEQADGWRILFYRSLSLFAAMLVYIAITHHGRVARAFLRIGAPGMAVSVFLGAAFMLFIFALMNATVANVVFTVSLSPFLAAIMAWLVMREAVARVTLIAMAIAFAGVAIMVGEGLHAGQGFGIALALGCGLCYSAAIVSMRKGRGEDMIPAVALAGAFVALVAGAMTDGSDIGAHDLAFAIALGVVQLAFQYMLVTTATRTVPAGEVALIGRLSLVLAPLWVWLAVDETPSGWTLMGGAVVAGAIVLHGAAAWRRSRAPAAY